MAAPNPSAIQPVHLRLPMGMQMDDAQFFDFCEANADYRIERDANGDIEIMPPTGGETGRRNSDLITDLNIWARQDGRGVVFDSSTGFRLPNGATRSPDAAWVSRAQLARLSEADKDRFLPLAPDFVLELASPNDDPAALDEKMQEYRANGVRLGWLLIPAAKQVRIYRPATMPATLHAPASLGGDDVLVGLELDLTRIWEPAL
jgi:Uma2 family endonuclease